MSEFLRDFDFCVQCLAKPADSSITTDHIIAKSIAKEHTLLLGGLVFNRRNEARVCWRDHRRIDQRKFRAYQNGGVSGLIIFIADHYPVCDYEQLLITARRQFAFLFSHISDKICAMNGDVPKLSRDDYKRAYDLALDRHEKFT